MQTSPKSRSKEPGIVLPAIPKECIVKYSGPPRRYTDSKPFQTQTVTHASIIEIGSSLQKSLITQIQDEKNDAIREAERICWEHAERVRLHDIEEVRKECNLEKQRALEQLKKEMVSKQKEQLLAAEVDAQERIEKAVYSNQQKCDKYLNACIDEQKSIHEVEITQAMDDVRKKERSEAAHQLELQQREAMNNLELEIEERERVLHRSLAEQKKMYEQLSEKAVRSAVNCESDSWRKQLTEMLVTHTHALAEKNLDIVSLKENIRKLEVELQLKCEENSRLVAELLDTRDGFQQLIDETWPYNPKQSDFPLPPLQCPIPVEVLDQRIGSAKPTCTAESKSEANKRILLEKAEAERLEALDRLRHEMSDERDKAIEQIQRASVDHIKDKILEIQTLTDHEKFLLREDIAALNKKIEELEESLVNADEKRAAILSEFSTKYLKLLTFIKKAAAQFLPPEVQPPLIVFEHPEILAEMKRREEERILSASGEAGESLNGADEDEEDKPPEKCEAGAQTYEHEDVLLFANECEEARHLYRLNDELKRSMSNYMTEILNTRSEFQHYIDETLPFSAGRRSQNNYCMPPIAVPIPPQLLFTRDPRITVVSCCDKA